MCFLQMNRHPNLLIVSVFPKMTLLFRILIIKKIDQRCCLEATCHGVYGIYKLIILLITIN